MPRRNLTADRFRSLLSETLRQPVRAVHIMRHVSRAYSDIWFLDVVTESGVRALVVKGWPSDTFFKQVALMKRAHTVFAGDDAVCIPYIGELADDRLLVMKWVTDPAMATQCRFALRNGNRAQPPWRTSRSLRAACAAAGHWLDKWHSSTADRVPLAPAFESYLRAREDCLALLSPTQRSRLTHLVHSLGTEPACTPHGDFIPANVLWSPAKLTILDFGVSEWEQMTPWWDCVSMEIALQSQLRFAWTGLGLWLPWLPESVIDTFRLAYRPRDSSQQARLVCAAVRHLVLYAEDTRRGYRRRAAWHHRELDKALVGTDAL
jgi:hypothetical protein